jgi:hypothetical protein
MSEKIYKYHIKPEAVQVIEMPIGAKILDVQWCRNRPVLWACIDPESPMAKYKFYCVGTGWDMPKHSSSIEYVGTYQVPREGLVFHIFKEIGYVD